MTKSISYIELTTNLSAGQDEANGWAPDGTVQEQIEDSVKDVLAIARARMPSGEGLDDCEECGELIPLGTSCGTSGRSHVRRLPVSPRQATELCLYQSAREQGQSVALTLTIEILSPGGSMTKPLAPAQVAHPLTYPCEGTIPRKGTTCSGVVRH